MLFELFEAQACSLPHSCYRNLHEKQRRGLTRLYAGMHFALPFCSKSPKHLTFLNASQPFPSAAQSSAACAMVLWLPDSCERNIEDVNLQKEVYYLWAARPFPSRVSPARSGHDRPPAVKGRDVIFALPQLCFFARGSAIMFPPPTHLACLMTSPSHS